MEKKSVTILLVDDHAIVRYGIRSLIERNDGLKVCGEAGTLQEAYHKVSDLKPDIVLLDIKLPDGDGAAGCREIKKRVPDVKVIILTAYAEDSIILEAVKAGAEGYLLKDIDSKNIITAIRNVVGGKTSLANEAISKVLNEVKQNCSGEDDLTSQDKSILELISQGKSNKDIAKEIYVSEKTVRNNASRIFKKINAGNRTEAAIYWSKRKILK
ncbi:two component transcriptional regulator, LuxR family [Alkaliphilus metalliredigens QYMF]|uniref:Stage 0 sporulation protein A homolog n=1 Tax=Alkaliphilus metalliredigens (strain QYMF) TaxID=293826 RepID=A6TNJ5_ALKMQ|nr:response regulator transcription factor [Alkaliphilus metalliredigens]ABR47763.1 two component transcriptional regulator, LuxR family [Alkaliphilus metalliredigens QYMF]